MNGTGQPPQLRIVPFVPGHRPAVEETAPGLGSSDDVALILPGEERDRARILYDVSDGLAVRARLSFTGPDGSLAPVALPGWEDRPAPDTRIGERRVLEIDPATGPDRFTFGELFSQRILVELTAVHD